MIYTGIGDNLAEIQYREDPLAKEIKPDYNKLSMSAWGMPQLNDLEQFNPKMEDKADTIPDAYSEYVKNFNDLKSTAQQFLKLGKDITKPSLEPDVNAAHLEWLKMYNDNIKLGKELSQSRVYRDKYENNYLGKQGVWTNPIGNEIVTGLGDYAYSPDFDTFEKGILAKAKKREQLYKSGQVDLANAENDEIKMQLDSFIEQVPPAFKEQALKRAENLKSLIPDAIEDTYKQDKFAFQKQQEANKNAWKAKDFALKSDYQQWRKQQSLPIEFDTKSLIEEAGNGNMQAIALIQHYYGVNQKGEPNGAQFNTVKGNEIINGYTYGQDAKGNDVTVKAQKLKDINGDYEPIDPNAKYFFRLDPNGNRFITKVTPKSILQFTQGLIGKSVEDGTSKYKTSNLYQDDETVTSDVPISSKNNSGSSGTIKNKEVKKVTKQEDLRKKYDY